MLIAIYYIKLLPLLIKRKYQKGFFQSIKNDIRFLFNLFTWN